MKTLENRYAFIDDIYSIYDGMKCHSAWAYGIRYYIGSFVDDIVENARETKTIPETREELKTLLLNGAKDWHEYSWGGGALIYDWQIAHITCSPSELKKTDNGNKQPNAQEQWLDVQARALCQAFEKLCPLYLDFVKAF